MDARQRLGLDDGPLLLHLGVMLPADATFLFDALRQLREMLPTIRLVMVGPYRGAVPRDVEAVVRRTGFVDESELTLWLAAADAGVLVLRDNIASRGRWPSKLSEYLSAGLPIVTTRVGPAAELVAAAGAAAVAEPEPAALAHALAGVLADEPRRRAMRAQALALAAGRLSWSSVAASLLDFYELWRGAQAGAAGLRNAGGAA
jgi:glycosyltransferase involved in cell wall biosynthesis